MIDNQVLMARLIFVLALLTSSVAANGSERTVDIRLESMLLRILRPDPTIELSERLPMSIEQQHYANECYAIYLKSMTALGEHILKRAEQEGILEIMQRDEQDVSDEEASWAVKRLHSATQSSMRHVIQHEDTLFDSIKQGIASIQMDQYRRVSLEIRRRLWLSSGGMKPQDFAQFPDPISSAISHRPALIENEEILDAFDELVINFETEMQTAAPTWVYARHDSRQRLRSARCAQDEKMTPRLQRQHRTRWISMYNRLSRFVNDAANILAEAGSIRESQMLREAFWKDTFPDLIGHESLPTLLDSIDVSTLDEDHRPLLTNQRLAFFERRTRRLEQLIRSYLRDYQDGVVMAPLPSFGMSSVEVSEIQIQRNQDAMQTRQRLDFALQQVDPKLIRQLRQEANRAGVYLLDSKQTLNYLKQTLEQLQEEIVLDFIFTDPPENKR